VGLLTKRISDHFTNKHITQKYLSSVKIFGCDSESLTYDFPLNPECVHQVDESFQRVKLGKYLVFNAFAGGKGRVLSDDKIIEIVRMISAQLAFHKLALVFVAPAEHMVRIQHLALYCQDRLKIETYVFPRLTHLHHLGRIIQTAQVVISPDTSIIHMASAFHTPLVAMFRKDWPEGEQNCEVWAPQGTKFVRAFAREPSYLGEEVSINEISAMDVSGSLSMLLQMIKYK
jgi:ADP-heptose:LPS heptosyltransferase